MRGPDQIWVGTVGLGLCPALGLGLVEEGKHKQQVASYPADVRTPRPGLKTNSLSLLDLRSHSHGRLTRLT
jgi:hypothetical protein